MLTPFHLKYFPDLENSSFHLQVCGAATDEQPKSFRYQSDAMAVQRLASFNECLLFLLRGVFGLANNLQLEVMKFSHFASRLIIDLL